MDFQFPLLLDGPMGTQLYKSGMPSGACPEQWSVEHPEVVSAIQRAYIDAGSRVISTPTFGANAKRLSRHGIVGRVAEFNKALAGISVETANGKALVAGNISPTGELLYPLGNMKFEEMYDIYVEQASALEAAGVDLFFVETMMTVPEARAAVLAIKSVSDKPVFVSFSCDENGRTMTGTDICAALKIMQGMGVCACGMNCSVGPEQMLRQVARLYEIAEIPIIAKPNVGLPDAADGNVGYSVTVKDFSDIVPRLAEAGAAVFGCCCGGDENYVAAVRKQLDGISVKSPSPAHPDMLPCATEKNVYLLEKGTAIQTVLSCDELEDELFDLEEDEPFGVRIDSEEDVDMFTEIQYAIRNPLCFICDDAELLEKALRSYQGRAMYMGSLPADDLSVLSGKYGLIVLQK